MKHFLLILDWNKQALNCTGVIESPVRRTGFAFATSICSDLPRRVNGVWCPPLFALYCNFARYWLTDCGFISNKKLIPLTCKFAKLSIIWPETKAYMQTSKGTDRNEKAHTICNGDRLSQDIKLCTSIKQPELRSSRCPLATSLPFKNMEHLPRFFKEKEPSFSNLINACQD